jgi:hypothetical protein
VAVEAVPFFFTGDPSRFTFDWSINGKAPETSNDPEKLVISLAPGVSRGFDIQISLLISNSVNALEQAGRSISLAFKP